MDALTHHYRHRPTPVRAWQWDGTDDDARRIGDALRIPPLRMGASVSIGGVVLWEGRWALPATSWRWLLTREWTPTAEAAQDAALERVRYEVGVMLSLLGAT